MADTLTRLMKRLDLARPELDRWESYMRGTVPLEFVAPEVRAALGNRLRTLQVPWARHVIGAIEERLTINGFRTEADGPTDSTLWQLWQANGLDEASQLAHAEALAYGRAFVLVWADVSGVPVVTVESARQCAVLYDPATRSRVAGIKRWVADELGHAVLFEPTKITRLQTTGPVRSNDADTPGSIEGAIWQVVEAFPNPLGVVPLVPLVNRPSILDPYGRSELEELTPLLDAITKLNTDLMVSAEYHASPRRWITGLMLEEESDAEGFPTGNINEGHRFANLPGRLYVAEDPSAKFGQFPGADLRGFLDALQMFKRDLSATASLPFHYLGLFGDTPTSGDAIQAAEASLVSLVARKAQGFGGAWEEALRIAHAISVGYWDGSLSNLETVWADFELRTWAEASDAATKVVSANILDPDFAAEKLLGLTPTEIQRNADARRSRNLETVASQLVTANTSLRAVPQ